MHRVRVENLRKAVNMRRYYENGKLDKLTTYINNHDWIMPVVVIAILLIAGFIDAI